MLPCIACSKQADQEAVSDGGTPKSITDKDGLKSLSHQLKDMVLKASVAYRQCKPGSAAIFDDDPPSFDEFITPSSSSSEIGNSKSGKREYWPGLTRSISRKDAGSSSVKSQESDRLQVKSPHARIPKSPASSAHLRIGNQQLGSEKSLVKDEVGQEWVAQVEPGVLITFVTLPNGGNELKRIRFSREIFNKWQAEVWWTANSEKVHELYNVFGKEKLPATLPNNLQGSKEVRNLNQFGIGASPANSPRVVGDLTTKPNVSTTQSSNAQNPGSDVVKNEPDAASIDNASGSGSECVTEDEPGVYITIKVLPGGSKALKRVRFRQL
ncbi:hypothetical protein O6H91_03G127600 [Diphasiastrum complanatum]|uniref:Uncharacterized protein n=2 Tax=Diphasiastrum complanatum TaxID=34168 RepID=A0ACC2EB48_DIPCM|nr:hypothetical protein O6H91_03G127600 [Diphasiastrum complanatum]KAJ7563833.1 hypothetical protein O6H91_03G127600 [Diphasiastrum complanatum]